MYRISLCSATSVSPFGIAFIQLHGHGVLLLDLLYVSFLLGILCFALYPLGKYGLRVSGFGSHLIRQWIFASPAAHGLFEAFQNSSISSSNSRSQRRYPTLSQKYYYLCRHDSYVRASVSELRDFTLLYLKISLSYLP